MRIGVEPAVATLRPCGILWKGWQFPSSEAIHHHRITTHSWPSSTLVTILCHLETTPVRKLYLSQPQLSHSHSHIYPQTESGIDAISRFEFSIRSQLTPRVVVVQSKKVENTGLYLCTQLDPQPLKLYSCKVFRLWNSLP